jgi:hypothetical protein
LFSYFLFIVIGLSWIGSLPAEEPFLTVGRLFTTGYFIFFLFIFLFSNFNTNTEKKNKKAILENTNTITVKNRTKSKKKEAPLYSLDKKKIWNDEKGDWELNCLFKRNVKY